MTTLYLIRHGEAMGNVQLQFQGKIDKPLTARGLEQTRYLEQRFASIPVDVLYSSPLNRAYETAAAVSRATGCKIHVEPMLAEIDGGDWEGKSWKELPDLYPEAFDDWVNHPARFQAPGGESMEQVYQRAAAILTEIIGRHPGKRIAVATHGCFIRNALCFLLGYPISEMNRVPLADNTAISAFQIEGTSVQPVFLNDNSHLPQELSSVGKYKLWKEAPADARDAKQE